MAIAFDNAATNQANAVTTNSFSLTVGSVANRIGIVGVQFATGTDVLGTPTFGGNAMTLIGSYASGGAAFNKIYTYYVLNPSSGSNTISINNQGGANFIYASAAAYAGVIQTSPVDVSGSGTTSGTSFSKSLTTTVNNDWLVGFFSGCSTGASLTAGSATTFRTTVAGNSWNNIGDSNGPNTPAGTFSLAENAGTSDLLGIFAIALKPFVSPANGNFLAFM